MDFYFIYIYKLRVHACVFVFKHAHVYVRLHAYVYMCTYAYVCTYMSIHVSM